jgi:arginine:agmatine antiporter
LDQTGANAGIGPFMGTLLVTTTMIGSGVFLLPATLAAVGTISVLGWLIAASGALCIGLTLAVLCPVSNRGFLDAIGVALGPQAGQVAALLYFVAFPLIIAAVALAAGGNIGFLVPALAGQPQSSWLAVGFVLLLVGLVHSGALAVARVGSLTLLFGLIPILLVATVGWTRFDAQVFRAGWIIGERTTADALFQATLLCFWAFLGLETASVISRQMRDPARSVPIATVGGILLATLIYVSATTAISGMIPADALAKSTAPFADATRIFLGPVAAVLVALAAAAKALGTLGATQLSGTETWLGFQRLLGVAGIPFRLANPILGLLSCAVVLATASPTLASQYGQIISAVVVLSLLVFALAGAAAARARKGLPRLIGLGTILFSLGLIAVQPGQTILLAAATSAVLLAPLMLLRLRRASLAEKAALADPGA